jgi:pyrimidine-nucleoside phosphorylase
MNFVSLIEAKRDGREVSAELLSQAVGEFAAGRVPDYQMSAFLMAVLFRGLSQEETRALTLAMRDSGEQLRFPPDPRPLVDKHSTGGVGDKVSLPLAPLLACLGFRVPMISGRGLGITGGTLDKLESIPGLRVAMPPAQVVEQVQRIGVAIVGQTDTMVPADKKLYALRDVTGTVPSIPLITASILSKKLAEGLGALVMDVKFGAAAFMPALEAARQQAESILSLANACGLPARALITDMNCPLGRTAGNWLEVREAIECLENRGPADLRELVLACAAHLLALASKNRDLDSARQLAADCLASGAPRQRWDEMIVAQGADLAAFNRKLALDQTAPVVLELRAKTSGYVQTANARVLGEVVRDLGGGRLTKDAVIHPEVGLDRLAQPGDAVMAGGVLARIHAQAADDARAALGRVAAAIVLSDSSPPARTLIHAVAQKL